MNTNSEKTGTPVLARKLPQHKTFPRYCKVGEAIADCARDGRGCAVRLSSRKWISTERWNQLCQIHPTIQAVFAAALAEAGQNRLEGKIEYAKIRRALDNLDNPGFVSRGTLIAKHATTQKV